ncbi:MAG: glycosyltransferase family 4 protein [Aureibaculum sp.]|nr:glycosyltransferase family 4 protein [Aureibaculum sp.]
MKVLYLSSPPFFDLDLSFVKQMSKECDIHYLMNLSPYELKFTALSINNQKLEGKIYNAEEFIELHKFKKYIPLNKFHVINRPTSKVYSYSNLRLQSEIVKFIDKINPDIIHCGSILNTHFLYFLLSNKRKIILTVHDPFLHSGEETLRDRIIRKLNYLCIKNIVLLNDNQKEKFIKATEFFRFKNVFNSSLGIYEYLLDYKVNQPSNKIFKILFFGRISMYKGIDDLLAAFSMIEKSYPNIELIIAGRGKYWFDISEYQNNFKIKILNRFIPNEELVELISNTNIVVCPYKDATQSGVVMSAFALNKPVLGTRVGGLPEMIEEGKTGFLVPPNDVVALSEKLKELIENRNYLNQMGLNIKKEYTVGEKSWSGICKGLYKFYSEI